MTLGVTIGKFHPFHRGHDLLIRSAKAQCDRLVVLVCARDDQSVPGDVRADWIRTEHPDVEVRLLVDDLPEAPEPWARRTLEVLGRRPDVAFTSEAYGDAWAAAMGARHVAIDLDRRQVPISGSALRADPAAHWAQLTPPAKAWLARRVRVMGVESSGTTTLAADLARHYSTVWVPEHGRWYWEGRRHLTEPAWTSDEFLRIATAQQRLEDDLARLADLLVVCDTDALATHVWHRRYLGSWHPDLARLAGARRYDLTLLAAPDFGFVQDGTRESEQLRDDMHRWFHAALGRTGQPFVEIRGAPAERLATATALIDPLLQLPAL